MSADMYCCRFPPWRNRYRHEVEKHPNELKELRQQSRIKKLEIQQRKLSYIQEVIEENKDVDIVSLLNEFDLSTLLNSTTYESQVQICCSKLSLSFFICKNVTEQEILYNFDNGLVIFKELTGTTLDRCLQSIVITFLGRSIEAVNRDCPNFYNKYCQSKDKQRVFQKISEGSFFSKPEIWKMKLYLDSSVSLDNDLTGLHFLNGRLDLLSLQFSRREPRQFITRVLNYDYVPPDDVSLGGIRSFLSNYFIEEEALLYFLSMSGKSLRGGNVKDCLLFYFYGEGSCGKTSFLNFLQNAFDSLIYQMGSSSLDTKSEVNNTFNGILPYHCFLFWNEPTPKKKISSAIKTLCDGVVSTRQLFSNSGYKTKEINAKLFASANYIATFDVGYDDSGLTRRLCYYKFKNKFTGASLDYNVKDRVYSIAEKSALIYLMAYYGRLDFPRPGVCQSGEDIFSWKNFEATLLERNKESMISGI